MDGKSERSKKSKIVQRKMDNRGSAIAGVKGRYWRIKPESS
jgi:hypothetical protein